MEKYTTDKKYAFLQGGGEMGELTRNYDWSKTPIGTPDQWPPSLRTTVGLLLHSAFPTLLFWGKEMLISFYNDAAIPSLGVGRHPAIGTNAREIWADNWDFIGPLIIQVIETGEPVYFEDKFRNGQVKDIYWTFNYSPAYGDDGKINGVFVTCTETTKTITATKASQEIRQHPHNSKEVWDSETYFRQLNDNVPAVIWLTAPDGTCTYLNKRWYEVTGQTEEQASGLGWLAATHPDDRESSGEKFLHANAHQEPFSLLYRLRQTDGTYRWTIDRGAPRFNTDGSYAGMIGTVVDMHDQIMAEEALRSSEQNLRNAFIQAPVAISLLKGPDFIIEIANPKLLEQWGKTEEEVIGKPVLELFSEVANNGFDKLLRNVFTTGERYSAYGVLYPIKRAGKQEDMYISFTYEPYKEMDGTISGVMSVSYDVTSEVTAREELRNSEIKFRALVEEAPVPTCLFVGRDMVVEVANDAILSVWGKDQSALGKKLKDAVPELEGQPFLEILDTVFTTGKSYSEKAARADLEVGGVLSTFYFDFTYKPLFNTDGEVYGIMDMAVDVTEQVLAKQRVEEVQRELLASFEEAPVAIATISEDNLTFRMANPFYAELVGRKREEIIDKPLLEALPELVGQGFDVLLKEVIATGKPFVANEVSVDIVRKGRLETIYVDLTYQPRRDETNRNNGVLVVATDVTQQVLSRREVEASEERLRGIIAAAPAGIGLFVGRDLIIEYPNQTFIDIVGKGPGVEGLPLREAMPELITEGQPFLQILDDVFTSGKMFQSFGSQVKIVQNGILTDNYYNITYTPVFNAQGKVYAILDIAIDVTDQIKTQQRLEEAETELRGAIELAGLSTWMLDIKANIYSYSPRFMEWLGFSENTKGLDDAYNPLPDSYRQSVPDAIAKVIAPGGSGIYENEHPIINRLTGQVRIIHAQAQVFCNTNGEAATLRGTAQDITEQRNTQLALEQQVRQRTEELASSNAELAISNTELQHSNDELAQYAYVASHDLQEPLRKIRIFSGMLDKQQNLAPESQELVGKINQSAERMTLLIKDLLEFSRLLNSDSLMQEVDLNEIIQSVSTDFELIIQEKQAILEVGDLPVIEAVSLQMNQLFYNLISNGLKFTAEGTVPHISIQSRIMLPEEVFQYISKPLSFSKYYLISCSDNGIGFDTQYAEQIFEVFKRLHGRHTYPGSGIGLSLCRRIVVNHNGIMYAVSELDKGSTFYMILPEQQEVEEAE